MRYKSKVTPHPFRNPRSEVRRSNGRTTTLSRLFQRIPPLYTCFRSEGGKWGKSFHLFSPLSTCFHLFAPSSGLYFFKGGRCMRLRSISQRISAYRNVFFSEAIHQSPITRWIWRLPAYSNVFQLIPTYFFLRTDRMNHRVTETQSFYRMMGGQNGSV